MNGDDVAQYLCKHQDNYGYDNTAAIATYRSNHGLIAMGVLHATALFTINDDCEQGRRDTDCNSGNLVA